MVYRYTACVLSAVFKKLTLIMGGLLLSSFAVQAYAQSDALTEEDVFGDIPVVMGSSHFPQKISDAPTAVSIIDRQMIDASAAIEIVDLFKLLPGFQVYYPHHGRHAINYHGFPQEFSYRMEVKIDGRSVYEPAENSVLWPTLPIELDDIDYIEVIRGANAPADGANATIASVNIITKAPVASKGWRLRTTVGDWDTRKVSFAYSGLHENFSYKVNGGHRYSSGYSDFYGFDPEDDGQTEPELFEFDDDVESSYINVRSIITPSLYDSIDIQLGYSNSNIDMADSGRSIGVDDIIKWNYETIYFFAHWERQLANQDSYELLFYYNHADIEAPQNLGLFSDIVGIAPEDVPIELPGLEDFEVVYGLFDSYSTRGDIEFRYKGNLTANTRYMWGVASRYDTMRSARQFVDAVDVEESSQRLFSNIESRPSERWTFNLGAIVEYNDVVNDYSSYRVSANYHFNPQHTLRLAFNDGERSPGLYEANQNGGVVMAGYVLDVDTVAPDDLSSEKFESQEISYYGTLMNNTLTLELKLFKEKSRDLVKYTIRNADEYFPDSDPRQTDGFGTFTLRSNSASVEAEGIEAYIKYQPDSYWFVNFQYSNSNHKGVWLRQVTDDKGDDYRQWDDIAPSEMGSLTVAYFFDSGYETSVMWYYQDEVEWEQGDFSDDYHRFDLRLAKRIRHNGDELLLELIAQNITDEGYTEFHFLNEHESRLLFRATMGF